ncbi:sensor histidine kinase [Novosphingobium sp. KCTC 2891]|uniref:sensor histidine kinase n=1 Tax=Novosphingobium sp. KCTC 2891 TaxID=2989730 RepID=UPI0039B6BFB9
MASSPASSLTEPEALPLRPHVPARQVVLSALALWLCYFVLITLRGLVVELGEFQELLWRRALVTLAGIAVTLLAWPLIRRFDGRSIGLRVGASLVIMLPAALALAVVNQQAFAPVEQRFLDRVAAEEAAKARGATAAPAPDANAGGDQPGDAASTSVTTSTGVRVRHDVSGNVLVDVMDPIAAPVPPEPAPPPPAPVAPQAKAAPPAPPEIPLSIRSRADGSSEMLAPGGVVIRRNADGTAQVRAGGMVVQVDGADADEIARGIEEARRHTLEARGEMAADARREAEEARREALEETRRALAEAGIAMPPAPPAPPVPPRAAAPSGKTAPAHKAPPAVRPAARPAPHPAAVPTAAATPKAVPSPAPEPAAYPAPAPVHAKVIRKAVEDEGLWRQLTDVALGRYFLLIAWAALYLALGNGEMARAAEQREGEYRRAAKSAELRSLRYQVNPHFLFNTLNSLSALVMVGRSEQAEKMIQTISSFYRHSLATDPTADVPLSDEIALQRHYLEIEAVRFPERLRTEFDVPEDLMSACVPGMILQPLVENSIKYAVSASTRPVTIRIAAREASGLLVLTVADDGPGKVGESGSTGIGLDNVRQRLAARFGDRARVESAALPAGGYATVLTLPVIHHDC